MGADKARLELGGRGLLERAVETLRAVAPRVALACGPSPRYAELGLELVLDPDLGAGARPGPIAGILAGLEGLGAERVLALACDMPRVDAELVTALVGRARAESLDACLFESASGLEPLCAVYHRRCAAAMRAALAAGERRVVAFLAHPAEDEAPLRVGRVHERELGGPRRERALNLNTPHDFARERARWEAAG